MNTTMTDTIAPKSETTGLTPCAEMMKMSPSAKEHEWLAQLAGEWDLELEMLMGPDQPSMKSRGLDVSRLVGGYWLVSEGKNLDFPYDCRLTLGFDVERKKYVGTWVDSMSSHLWHYVGEVDATGRTLTLETEGPFPSVPGRKTKFREVTELTSPDERIFTSSRLEEDGRWAPMLRIVFRRRSGKA